MSEVLESEVGPLVNVAWLLAHSKDPRVRIADCRWYLGGKRGSDAYTAGHIPGAVFVDLDAVLAAPKSSSGDVEAGRAAHQGRHPLPSASTFASALSPLGIGEDTTVVAYDDAGGAIAARLWWLLRFFGHAGGRVLDGGIQGWVAKGLPLSTEPTSVAVAPRMELTPRRTSVVDKATVEVMSRDPSTVVLDARARERYEGRLEPVDARPGHIPGARSAPFAQNLLAPEGPMRPIDELRAHYRALGALDAARVVTYCGSGVTACHDLLALSLLGREDALLYEGSWSDWAADPTLPAATGPDPTNSQ